MKWYKLIFLLIIFSSCQKDKIDTKEPRITLENISIKEIDIKGKFLHRIDFVDTLNGYGTNDHEIYKTVDGGHNWELVYSGETDLEIIALDMFDIENIFITARILNNDPNIISNFTHYLIKSNNEGKTFEKVKIPIDHDKYNEPRHLKCISADKIFISGRGTLIHSDNGGVTWKEENTIETPISYNKVSFDGYGNGYCGSKDGMIMYSNDFGESWRSIQSNVGYWIHDIYTFNDNLYFRSFSNLYTGTFDQLSNLKKTHIGNSEENADPFNFNLLHIYDEDIILDIGYVFTPYASVPESILYISNDGGASWSMNTINNYLWFYSPVSIDKNNIMAITSTGDTQLILHVKISE